MDTVRGTGTGGAALLSINTCIIIQQAMGLKGVVWVVLHAPALKTNQGPGGKEGRFLGPPRPLQWSPSYCR